MANEKQISLRISPELYEMAKHKCKNTYGISMSALIKMFLRAFVKQGGIGFWVGDDDIRKLFNRYLRRKSGEINRKGCFPLPGPQLRDIYDF